MVIRALEQSWSVQVVVWWTRVHLSIVILPLCLVLSCVALVAFVWVDDRWDYFDLCELACCFQMGVSITSVSTWCRARNSLLRPVWDTVVGHECFSRVSIVVSSSELSRWGFDWNTWIYCLVYRTQLSISLHLLTASLLVVIAAELCRFFNLILRVESVWNARSLSWVAYFLYCPQYICPLLRPNPALGSKRQTLCLRDSTLPLAAVLCCLRHIHDTVINRRFFCFLLWNYLAENCLSL